MTSHEGPSWRRLLIFWGPRAERDIDDELAFHVQARVDEYVAAGMDPERARIAALERLGDADRYRSQVIAIDRSELRSRTMMEALRAVASDVRYGIRQLRRNRTLNVAAVLSFALGIGANTSIFSVVNAVLFRPLRFPDSERLVLVSEGLTKINSDLGVVSAPDYIDFKEVEGRTFESLALVTSRSATLAVAGDAEQVSGAAVTASLFQTLRVKPAIGRVFTDDDARPGAPFVTILSDALWRRRFNGDSSIVGKTIAFPNTGRLARVIGVMPPTFAFPIPGLGVDVGEIFFPFTFTPQVMAARADSYNWLVLGRLLPGITVERARASLTDVARQFPRRYPETYGRMAAAGGELLVHAKPLRAAAVGEVRGPLLVLLAGVGFVLLIACFNVSSLLMARATARRREIAVRRALGATRARLLQQFLAEALVLVTLGSVIGVIAAHWGTRALVAVTPGDFYRSFDVSLDGRVLGLALIITVVTAVVLSTLPGVQGRGSMLQRDLCAEGRSFTTMRIRQRARRALIVMEIALALVLTIGAGLMLRSFAKANAADPGFDPAQLTAFRISLPERRYGDRARVHAAALRIAEQLRRIPGVRSASATTNIPMAGGWAIGFTPDGDPLPNLPTAANALVLPQYFETMGIPVRAGRSFTLQDRSGMPPVVIVNETLARQYYGTANAVGRRLKWGSRLSPDPWSTIIGVVADVRQNRLDEEPKPSVYMPMLQQDTGTLALYRNLSYVVRTAGPPSAVINSARNAVREVDPSLVVVGAGELSGIMARTIAARRFNSLLLGLFAALALSLAATGVYGVLQYSVLQRTREIGVRMALGALPSMVVRLVVGEASALALGGIVIGLAGAFALTRVIRTLLFEISPFDLPTFAASAAILWLVAVLSSYLPARRALRTDPTAAMRAD